MDRSKLVSALDDLSFLLRWHLSQCLGTYCSTGVRSAMKECARYPYDLCLHLSHARENVWVKWIAPCKISINLRKIVVQV